MRLSVDIASGVPRYVCTDEGKLRQVLINILSNAVKFTQKGTINVRVSELDAFAELHNSVTQHLDTSTPQQLLFEIEDTGIGIAPENIGRMFEPFTRNDNRLQAQEGTGLGLPISRKFVRLMGGDMTLTSDVGRGTIVCFTIQAQVVDDTEMIKYTGVRLVHEEETPLNTPDAADADLPSALAQLPPDLPKQLLYAVKHSDVDLMDRVIDDMRAYQPTAAAVFGEWAKNFQYEEMLEALQEGRYES